MKIISYNVNGIWAA